MDPSSPRCDCCDGSGRHPVAAFLVPSKGTHVECGACGGTGKHVWRLPAEAKA